MHLKHLAFACCILSLAFGILAGLHRAGLSTSVPPTVVHLHGAWMLAGVFIPLITLERVAALQWRPAYLFPLFAMLGNFLLAMGHTPIAQIAYNVCGLGLVVLATAIVQRQPSASSLCGLAGALLAFTGVLTWSLGAPIYGCIHLWCNFLLFTILGERLEFSRWTRGQPGRDPILALGLTLSLFTQTVGVAWMLLCLWLLNYDVARRTLKGPPLTRRIAQVLLVGYLWLGVAGLILALGPHYSWPGFYDAWLHTFFLGFIGSMVMGHAPMVFPSLMGLPIGCLSIPILPVVFLHLSLMARLVADSGWLQYRHWAALGNAVALAAFAAYQLVSILQTRRKT